ncbi:MAG TPA: energy transducer TonB [Polyangiaceae bacterium]
MLSTFASTTLGSRALLVGVSAIVHVAAFGLLARGEKHGDDLASVAATTAIEIPIDTKVDEPVADDDHDHAAHEHAHTHTHPYPVSPDHDRIDHDPSIQHTPYAAHDHADETSDHADPAAAPAAMTAEASAPAVPHFSISIGNAPTAHGSVAGNAQSTVATNATPGTPVDDAPVAESQVSTRATLEKSGVLVYPAEAREQEVEADVPVEIVVAPTGEVVAAKALAHVGYGLDEAAVTAVRGYRFHPARKGDHAVAVRMHWDVSFKLR